MKIPRYFSSDKKKKRGRFTRPRSIHRPIMRPAPMKRKRRSRSESLRKGLRFNY